MLSDKNKVHHIRNVLRMKKDDPLIIFDKTGCQYLCEIEGLSEEQVILRVREKREKGAPEGLRLSVACAIPKKTRMDDIIDKLTQMGVARIIPLKTKHTVVKFDKRKEALRQERWNKIALSASEQSKRNSLPLVDPVRNFREFILQARNFDLKLIPTLKGERLSLQRALRGKRSKNILVAIGPEGDFSDDEVALARRMGFVPVSLGERVLRVDTAVLAITSFITLRYEDR
ncbi:MAG: RsmE family RNA methyltransferase [Candidatus Omnitrophota bacterium]